MMSLARFGILPASTSGMMTFQSAASQPINKTFIEKILTANYAKHANKCKTT